MKIIAASSNQIAGSFLHPGYMSASPPYVFGDTDVGSNVLWLTSTVTTDHVLMVAIVAILLSTVSIVLLLFRRRSDHAETKLAKKALTSSQGHSGRGRAWTGRAWPGEPDRGPTF